MIELTAVEASILCERKVYKQKQPMKLHTSSVVSLHVPYKRLQNGCNLVVVHLFGLVLNGEPVDDGENAAYAAGKELQNAHAGVAEHKSVHTEAAEENGDEEKGRGIL